MKLFECVILLLLSTVAFSQSPVEYDVSFDNAVHHEARITVTWRNIGSEPLQMRMSRSSPGRYATHEFGKNVYKVWVVDGDGNQLDYTRPNPYQWDVAGHDGTVSVTYTLYADRAGGTYSGIDLTHAHLNMPATFMWARGFDDHPISISFNPVADVNEVLESALRLAALNREDDGPVERTFAELPRIEAGGQDLKQAFFGLAQWAFSRVDRSERVDVGTALVDERVQVVFEWRAGRSRQLADRGRRMATNGIQLVIARQIIEQQGGTLEVEDFEDGFTRICAELFLEAPELEGVTGHDDASNRHGGAEAAGPEGDAR